mmetsp:Transcript_47921/g.116556  ORF Transcript_47921/g.116556 Transcript_47921/m.116556 type:complete len:334 (-) Transcript_47921:441-1442(-)
MTQHQIHHPRRRNWTSNRTTMVLKRQQQHIVILFSVSILSLLATVVGVESFMVSVSVSSSPAAAAVASAAVAITSSTTTKMAMSMSITSRRLTSLSPGSLVGTRRTQLSSSTITPPSQSVFRSSTTSMLSSFSSGSTITTNQYRRQQKLFGTTTGIITTTQTPPLRQRQHQQLPGPSVCRFSTTESNSSTSDENNNDEAQTEEEDRISVTGLVYTSRRDDPTSTPSITLFTKHGCTLCDKVKDVLRESREDHTSTIYYDHSLEQIDITDPEHSEWYDKYKYDIPVLHLNNQYWCKHRLTRDEAEKTLAQAREEGPDTFQARPGEPDAAKLERT